jgi:hypothetical protein
MLGNGSPHPAGACLLFLLSLPIDPECKTYRLTSKYEMGVGGDVRTAVRFRSPACSYRLSVLDESRNRTDVRPFNTLDKLKYISFNWGAKFKFH